MSTHVLLNLLNELGKSNFINNTGSRMLHVDSYNLSHDIKIN